MPFVNSAQRRACYYKRQDAINKGEPVKWDCKEMAKLKYAGRLRKVYKTERGAKYVNVNGKKVYVYGVY
jgi:hypothetical protein